MTSVALTLRKFRLLFRVQAFQDLHGQWLFDLAVSGNGLDNACLGGGPKGMCRTFPLQETTGDSQSFLQFLPFHQIAIVS